jgi:undecaprenyl-diphosphatase
MLETIGAIDQALFLFINVQLANPVTDFLMPIITSNMLLRIGYGAAMVLLLWKGDARLRWLVLFSAVTLALTDQISAGLLKPMLGRLRPCHVLENINLLVGCGGGKAMPSAHAANAFGQAILFSLLYSKVRWPLISFAAVVAISRVFVGVHYPADVLAGAMLGAMIAVAIVWLFNSVSSKLWKPARG